MPATKEATTEEQLIQAYAVSEPLQDAADAAYHEVRRIESQLPWAGGREAHELWVELETANEVLFAAQSAADEAFREVSRLEALIQPDWQDDGWDEGPTCPICDGLGHGVPGTRPCPIEDSGRYDDRGDRGYF